MSKLFVCNSAVNEEIIGVEKRKEEVKKIGDSNKMTREYLQSMLYPQEKKRKAKVSEVK